MRRNRFSRSSSDRIKFQILPTSNWCSASAAYRQLNDLGITLSDSIKRLRSSVLFINSSMALQITGKYSGMRI